MLQEKRRVRLGATWLSELFADYTTCAREAVNMIFGIIMKMPEHEYRNMRHHIARSLFSPEGTLYEEHLKLINDKVYEMMASGDHVMKERGKELIQQKGNLRTCA